MRCHHDDKAMERRDRARAAGCRVCPDCAGTGEVWKDVYVIDGWSVSGVTCPKCNGESWLDAQDRPYRID